MKNEDVDMVFVAIVMFMILATGIMTQYFEEFLSVFYQVTVAIALFVFVGLLGAPKRSVQN